MMELLSVCFAVADRDDVTDADGWVSIMLQAFQSRF